MITCYILIKLMGLLVRMCLWMVLLPIKLIFFPSGFCVESRIGNAEIMMIGSGMDC